MCLSRMYYISYILGVIAWLGNLLLYSVIPPVLHCNRGKRGQILGSVPNIEILVPVLHHKINISTQNKILRKKYHFQK